MDNHVDSHVDSQMDIAGYDWIYPVQDISSVYPVQDVSSAGSYKCESDRLTYSARPSGQAHCSWQSTHALVLLSDVSQVGQGARWTSKVQACPGK